MGLAVIILTQKVMVILDGNSKHRYTCFCESKKVLEKSRPFLLPFFSLKMDIFLFIIEIIGLI